MTNINLVAVLADRIKASELGQLVKEDDLYEITKQAIEKAFFEDRIVPKDQWSTKKLPPLIVEITVEHIRNDVHLIAKDWFARQPEEWNAKVRDAVARELNAMRAEEIGKVIAKEILGTAIETLTRDIQNRVAQLILDNNLRG